MSEELNKTEIKKELENEQNDDQKEGIFENQKSEKAVVIQAEVYKTIILYASRYANSAIPPSEWKEIYGVLIGHIDDDFVHVESAEALTFGHDTDVHLDNRHYTFIAQLDEELYNEDKKHHIVGWFHSHPNLGLFFSGVDLRNQLFFQTHKDGIGLVFDHTLLGKKKQEKIEGTEHTISKYDTGFEIYRINDVEMDPDDPNFNDNYHSVDYIVKGLNKFFFANVLNELSALVSAGKPLQSAYGEDFKLESNYTGDLDSSYLDPNKIYNNISSFDENILENIPMEENISFSGDDLFYNKSSKRENKNSDIRQQAEQLIFEGTQYFENKDIVDGVEKFEKAIQKYEKIGDQEKVFELLKKLSENCISSNHLFLAKEFSIRLKDLSEKVDNLFFRGEANYLLGYLLLKKGDNEFLSEGLNKIRDAAILFEKQEDYVGAATCFHKIGSTYQTRLNKLDNSCLFYREAIENYNKAILKSHPNRKSLWSKPEILSKKILELKDIIEEILPKLDNLNIRDKIRNDLDSINYNF
ncbi:MAG: hypothetical protein KGD63_08780 [Candidatus Lokiarchaeota archaeon]|nr:hypothetical protein [Candidatus Lokiarchaeota archaeon]